MYFHAHGSRCLPLFTKYRRPFTSAEQLLALASGTMEKFGLRGRWHWHEIRRSPAWAYHWWKFIAARTEFRPLQCWPIPAESAGLKPRLSRACCPSHERHLPAETCSKIANYGSSRSQPDRSVPLAALRLLAGVRTSCYQHWYGDDPTARTTLVPRRSSSG